LALQDLWSIRHIFADVYLKEWLGWATRSQLAPMMSLAKTIKQHEEGILLDRHGLHDRQQALCSTARSQTSRITLTAL
jgi:hypothetical protein